MLYSPHVYMFRLFSNAHGKIKKKISEKEVDRPKNIKKCKLYNLLIHRNSKLQMQPYMRCLKHVYVCIFLFRISDHLEHIGQHLTE